MQRLSNRIHTNARTLVPNKKSIRLVVSLLVSLLKTVRRAAPASASTNGSLHPKRILMLGDAVPWKYVEEVVKATTPSPERLLAIKRYKRGAMASVNPISASCQSIAAASAGHPSTTLGGATSGTATAAQYIHGMGSLGRIKYHYQKQKGPDGSDDDFDVSQLSHSTHVLERVKSDHFLASKPDEDRRRRTIIVERKNDSYGFTLQSYGIHYKKEQEVEMITYVDYVEYDGPAYKAGMREGDVILSINGTDMEKADHKTLVDCIKSCDNRMRMVVLFEDCVKKVDLHMRYIQLQNVLQSRMNELERVCLRERELLEGKWKTHSLPARKKVTTSPTDFEGGLSPSDFEPQNAMFCRPTLSTEDVTNITRHQLQHSIIPPPAQYMLTYHYLNPTYRYVLKPSLSTSSGEYFVAVGEGRVPSAAEQHLLSSRTESAFPVTAASGAHLAKQHRKAVGPPPTPPPRTCEKHKPPSLQQQQQLQLQQKKQQQFAESKQKAINPASQKGPKSGRHCHGNSCNPCIGHFKWKSAEKTASVAGGDNVSLDAYDLASPCCDTHCVPTRKRNRHHKEHTHKHKHREREREREPKEHAPRPKSATQTSPSTARHVHHHHHIGSSENAQHQHHHRQYPHQHRTAAQQQQQQPSYESKTGSLRSRYFDLTAGLASHCSLHSCTSSELGAADSTSYTTSLSTDTLHWDPQSENPASRQHSTKSRQSYQQPTQPQQQQQQHLKQSQQQQHQHTLQQPHIQGANVYQQRYHLTATQIQPSQIYPNVCTYVNKPKSWDNLATKAIGGYGFGYGYLDTVAMKPPIKLQVAQQRHSMPRKNQNGRYSTYTDVENYAPPPSQFVGELTTTTTTMITTKSAEDLLSTHSKAICDCASTQQPPHLAKTTPSAYLGNQNPKYYYHQNNCHGYYSHLPRPTIDAGTSTTTPNAAPANEVDVATVSEVTRL